MFFSYDELYVKCVCVCFCVSVHVFVCVYFQGSELYSLLYSAYAEDMEYSFGSTEPFSVVITVLVLGKQQLVVGVDSDSVELITGEAEVCTYVYVCVCMCM